MTDLKFKAGDHVMVPATVEGMDGADSYRLKFDDGFLAWVTAAALASATLIERPLAVGDRVTWGARANERIYIISSIDGDMAVLRYLDDAFLTPLSELRRAEERG